MEVNIPNAVQQYIVENWNKNGLIYSARFIAKKDSVEYYQIFVTNLSHDGGDGMPHIVLHSNGCVSFCELKRWMLPYLWRNMSR